MIWARMRSGQHNRAKDHALDRPTSKRRGDPTSGIAAARSGKRRTGSGIIETMAVCGARVGLKGNRFDKRALRFHIRGCGCAYREIRERGGPSTTYHIHTSAWQSWCSNLASGVANSHGADTMAEGPGEAMRVVKNRARQNCGARRRATERRRAMDILKNDTVANAWVQTRNKSRIR